MAQSPGSKWRERLALITGASAGLGEEFARQLAAGGANLVLTARRADRLEHLAAGLRAGYGVQVECLATDLARPDAPQQIFTFTRDRNLTVDLLINNAGFGAYGPFAEIDTPRLTSMVHVNCEAVVHLTHLFLAGMIQRRRGDVLILASTAAFQGVPYMAVYGATKAFDLLFAEALAEEVKKYGVRVCALCPGSTESEFHKVANSPGTLSRKMETAEKVVRVGLEALAAGKHSVISGFGNRLGAGVQRMVPRRLVTTLAEKLFRPRQQPDSSAV